MNRRPLIKISAWVISLFGQSQEVHTWHHVGMWYLILFTLIHIYYIVVREDIVSDATVIRTMVNGWRACPPYPRSRSRPRPDPKSKGCRWRRAPARGYDGRLRVLLYVPWPRPHSSPPP